MALAMVIATARQNHLRVNQIKVETTQVIFKGRYMKPHFINVDFELSSLKDFSPLIAELNENIEVLFNEKVENKNHLNFEYSISGSEVEPFKIISMFFNDLEKLSGDGKKIIEACDKKVIDIGYNSGTEGWQYNMLPNIVLKKISDNGFQLNISIYGIDPHAGKSDSGCEKN
jgi:hypothetical protein